MSWPTLHLFADGDPLAASQLNGLKTAIEALETEVNPDGTITRDLSLFGVTGAVSNSGSAETDLTGYAYTLPANTMDDSVEVLYIEGEFTTNANANTKTVKLYIGSGSGSPFTIYTGAGNLLRVKWNVVVQRTGATSSTWYVETKEAANSPGSMGSATVRYGANAVAVTWSSAQTIKLTAQGTSTADVSTSYMRIRNSR